MARSKKEMTKADREFFAQKAGEKEAKKAEQTARELQQTYTKEEVADLIAKATSEAVAKAMESVKNAQQPATQIIQMVGETEKVVLRFQADVADDNVAVFGANGLYGQVTGKTGTVIVPKSEWSRFYDESNRRMIDKRMLIVVSGLDDYERALYHCDYKDGEILDEQAFTKIAEDLDHLPALFEKLCVSHQEMVARRLYELWQKRVITTADRITMTKLNNINKEAYIKEDIHDERTRGMLTPIIEEMNDSELNNH